jgi:hypothetical protein
MPSHLIPRAPKKEFKSVKPFTPFTKLVQALLSQGFGVVKG